MPHRCHALGCLIHVPPEMLMCQAADLAVAFVAEEEGKQVHPGKTFEKSFFPNGYPKI